MKAIAMIPARYAASRFPGKLMQLLAGKPVIRHTYDNTVKTGLFEEVMVVTDSEIIYNEITSNGGKAMMSIKVHESGSDRIAEAVADMEVDIVVNVQGDEPFARRETFEPFLRVFDEPGSQRVEVASLMKELKDERLINNPNVVKVVVDKKMNALLFSRSVIPYHRARDFAVTYHQHIGVYAYRKQALLNFTTWPVTPLEAAEKIECLRYLENSVSIRMVKTDYMGIGIDIPEDLHRAEAYLNIR